MKKIIIVSASLVFLIQMNSQSLAQDNIFINNINIGPGLGIDYGGIGGRISYLPVKYFALFGSVGFNIVGLGYNFGATFRILPDKKICPNFNIMYGYNAAIFMLNANQYNKIYYGPSLSVGMEIHMKKKKENFFNIELVVPFKPKEYTDDLNDIKNDPNIELFFEPLPIAFSIGYHFTIIK